MLNELCHCHCYFVMNVLQRFSLVDLRHDVSWVLFSFNNYLSSWYIPSLPSNDFLSLRSESKSREFLLQCVAHHRLHFLCGETTPELSNWRAEYSYFFAPTECKQELTYDDKTDLLFKFMNFLHEFWKFMHETSLLFSLHFFIDFSFK